MTRVKMLVVLAVAALSIMPGLATPANASHNCALEDVDHTVDTICDHYHDPSRCSNTSSASSRLPVRAASFENGA